MADTEIEIPGACFDVNGDVACFRCTGAFVAITPATRDWEDVDRAVRQHAEVVGHSTKTVLCIRGTDDKVHAWMPPD
jgi:hypothetical protein